MEIHRLPVFQDNYVFLLIDRQRSAAAVVDPGDPGPVLAALAESNLTLTAILNTHHHRDHTGGNEILRHRFPGIPVFGGASDRGRIPGQTTFLEDGARLEILGHQVQVLHVPGHTLGHVAYFFPDRAASGGDLFSGDTLFGCTIGNLFEGTPDQMLHSLRKIRALPAGTAIWCAHEYTRSFVREASRLDPQNRRLTARAAALEASAPEPTVPLSLAEECATNPFLRWDDPALHQILGTTDDAGTFRRLCESA